MSFKLERVFRQRKTEILITIGLLLVSIGLIELSESHQIADIGGKIGFSLLVAMIVRWSTIVFSEAETSVECDIHEYHEAIKAARKQVWIYQTWLPGIERDGEEILQSRASDKRLLLLSFEPSSPIHARIMGRRMSIEQAHYNSASSVKPLFENGQSKCIRFNHGHHPAWIAVIDSTVFWGCTPVHKDSQAYEFLFHKHPINSPEGAFWVEQFEVMWKQYSHSFDEEKKYNPKLKDLRHLPTSYRLNSRGQAH